MAKISIEIDGKDFSLKIDGKEVENLQDFSAWGGIWQDHSDGEVHKNINFDYSVIDKGDDAFTSIIRYFYNPSKASFNEGKKTVNTRHPSTADYEAM